MIKETVFAVTGYSFDGEIEETAFDGVYVRRSGSKAVIGYTTRAQMARCYFLLSKSCKEGNEKFEISEKPVFDLCGPMIDISCAGSILKVEAVKRYIDRTAALGLNMLMLYSEEIYDLEGYPMFGYLHGRYSEAELKEIDDYGYEMGVELVPCIQTLGHLSKYIRWGEAAEFAENGSVLLPDEEKTYAFIETEIKTMRRCFRSGRIHLGMDEADGLGLGKYFLKHGLHNRLDIFNKHLQRVLEIAKKYGYRSMIWGDMYFAEKDGMYYYEPDGVIPQHAVDNAPPEVELVFWDYYHDDYDYYDKKLAQYARFKNPVSFAGAVWGIDGFTPNFNWTYNSMAPALECCIDRGIKNVIACIWVSAGEEVDYFDEFDGMAVFSEYCYKGKACTKQDIYSAAALITNSESDFIDAVSAFHFGKEGSVGLGKGFLYCDPMIPGLLCYDFDYKAVRAECERSIGIFEKYAAHPRSEYFRLLFEIILRKADIIAHLQGAYQDGNIEYLSETAKKTIPELRKLYRRLYEVMLERKMKNNNPLGLEPFSINFGGLDYRLEYAQYRLNAYCEGKIDRLEELEEKIIGGLNKTWRKAKDYMKTNL